VSPPIFCTEKENQNTADYAKKTYKEIYYWIESLGIVRNKLNISFLNVVINLNMDGYPFPDQFLAKDELGVQFFIFNSDAFNLAEHEIFFSYFRRKTRALQKQKESINIYDNDYKTSSQREIKHSFFHISIFPFSQTEIYHFVRFDVNQLKKWKQSQN
jgi:hypothetical protein